MKKLILILAAAAPFIVACAAGTEFVGTYDGTATVTALAGAHRGAVDAVPFSGIEINQHTDEKLYITELCMAAPVVLELLPGPDAENPDQFSVSAYTCGITSVDESTGVIDRGGDFHLTEQVRAGEDIYLVVYDGHRRPAM